MASKWGLTCDFMRLAMVGWFQPRMTSCGLLADCSRTAVWLGALRMLSSRAVSRRHRGTGQRRGPYPGMSKVILTVGRSSMIRWAESSSIIASPSITALRAPPDLGPGRVGLVRPGLRRAGSREPPGTTARHRHRRRLRAGRWDTVLAKLSWQGPAPRSRRSIERRPGGGRSTG